MEWYVWVLLIIGAASALNCSRQLDRISKDTAKMVELLEHGLFDVNEIGSPSYVRGILKSVEGRFEHRHRVRARHHEMRDIS